MSWDVVLFSSSQKINAPEEIDETKLVPFDFYSALENHFPNFVHKGDIGEINGENYSIVYYYSDQPETNTLLNLYGEAAFFALCPLAIKHGWQIFDTGSGEMAELKVPEKNGFKKFTNYLKQILSNKD